MTGRRNAFAQTNATVSQGESRSEPSGWVTLGFFVLLAADLATLGAIAAQIAVFAALSVPEGPDLVGSYVKSSAGGLGMMLGVAVAGGYAIWPLQAARGGQPGELEAFRTACRVLLGLHPILLAGVAWDVWTCGADVISFFFLPAPVAFLATPMLIPVGRYALLRPGSPAAAAPAPALRRQAAAQAAPPPSPMWMTLLLPFAAAFQAGRPALALVSATLWFGAILLAFVSPLRAAVPFMLAYSLGWRAARPRQAALTPRPGPSTSGRSLPQRAMRGLLCVPPLYVLDSFAAAVLLALHRADTLDAFAGMVEGSAIVLIVALIFTMLPLMIFLPLNTRASEAVRPAASAALAIAHLALAAAFAAVSLRLPVLGAATVSADSVRVLIAPLTWTLLLTLPLAALLAASAAGGAPRRT